MTPPPSVGTPQGLRLLGVADTDSYVKWGAALLGAAPADWRTSLIVLSTPVTVSDGQLASALAGSGMPQPGAAPGAGRPEASVARATWDELRATLVDDPPDAVLIAARGPLVRVVAKAVAELAPRALIVTGLPGISIPVTRKALLFRAQCDLFVLHSHREVRDFGALAVQYGLAQSFALATLPFTAHARSGAPATGGDDLVFAAQALVPAERDDRRRVARLLVRAAEADPSRRVVVKLRATPGEHQTHAEADPYPQLLAELGPLPPNLVVSTEPMRVALDAAQGLLTVSSTAAIEALCRGIPVLALDSFGVGPELINVVFEGSGLFGGEDDVVARRFRRPDPEWVHDNYLHDPADDDWAARVAELVALRRAGTLPARPPLTRRGGRLRDVWERKRVLGPMDRTFAGAVALVIGAPLRAVFVASKRVTCWVSERMPGGGALLAEEKRRPEENPRPESPRDADSPSGRGERDLSVVP